MKICPACSREYSSESTHCESDGVALVVLQTGTEARPEELIGQIVDGRYRVERIIGRGGMGFVYAVRHVVVGKPAAMKVLRLGVERSEGVLQRFIREAQTASAVRSRHITEMSDFGQLPNGFFFVVMELLEGMTLTAAMRDTKLSREQCLHIFIQMAEALALVHEKGIIHRDLKPDNVFLVNENGDPFFVKLLDFGIAKVMTAEASGLTETGVILGTPYYMSPEQARGAQLDHRTDIYALGVMMYRAFTGKLPFVAESMIGVLTRHLTEAPEPPSLSAEIDVRTEHVILRCMEKSADRRFQSMSEVAGALTVIATQPLPPQMGGSAGGPPRHAATTRMDAAPHAQPSRPGHSYPGMTPSSGAYPSMDFDSRSGSSLPTSVQGYGPQAAAPPTGSFPGAPFNPASGGYPAVASAPGVPSGSYPNVAIYGAAPVSGVGPASGLYPSPAVTGAASTSGLYPSPMAPGGAPPYVGVPPQASMPELGTQRGLATSNTGSIALAPRRGAGLAVGIPIAVLLVAAIAAIAFFVGRGGRDGSASPSASSAVQIAPAEATTATAAGSAPEKGAQAPDDAASAAASASASASASAASSAETKTQKTSGGRYVPRQPPPASTATSTPREKRPEIRSPFE